MHCNALQHAAAHCRWRAAAWCRVSQSPVRTASCALFAHEHRISVVLQQCSDLTAVVLQQCLLCCNSVCCAAITNVCIDLPVVCVFCAVHSHPRPVPPHRERERKRERESERETRIEREGERNLHASARAMWGHRAACISPPVPNLERLDRL